MVLNSRISVDISRGFDPAGDRDVAVGKQGDPISKGLPAVFKQHSRNVDDTYSRIDYILLSKSMAKEWIPSETYVLASPNWGLASDHRPLVASFSAEDK